MMRRKFMNQLEHIQVFVKRNVINYKYRKRNLIIAGGIVASGIAVAFAGSAMNQESVVTVDSGVMEIAQIEENSFNVLTDMMTEPSTETIQVQVVTNENNTGSEFEGRFIANVEGTLNIRETASEEAALVGKMNAGAVGDILGVEGDWTKISSGEVEGYVKTDYILTREAAEALAQEYVQVIGTITDTTVRVREEMSTESKIVELVSGGTKLTVTSEEEGWVGVVLESGASGYISADFITVERSYEEALSKAQLDAIAAQEAARQAQAAQAASEASNTSGNSTSSNTGASNATTVSTTTNAAITVEYSDSYLLACLVSMEAGNESYEGQLAVANVVLNRLRSGRWGNTISSVIYAQGQFPSVNGSVMQGYLQNGPIASAQQAADVALAGTNNIGSYMSFINVKRAKYDSYSSYTVIGNHCFY